ncbi:MAG: hypothetical protein JXR97_06155 [Planctomycetes bacterium]|nr:hypothetical protein [Planctomycetota bacterium]
MQLNDFFDKVETAENLKGIGVDKPDSAKPGVVVEHTASGLTTRLPIEAIEKAEWDVIEEILVGKREPQVLQHMTRVVGYYSRIENWNKSKIGELNDRHKGNYAISGASSAC